MSKKTMKGAKDTTACAKNVIEDSWGNVKKTGKTIKNKQITKDAKKTLNSDIEKNWETIRKAYIKAELYGTPEQKDKLQNLLHQRKRLLDIRNVSVGNKHMVSTDTIKSKLEKDTFDDVLKGSKKKGQATRKATESKVTKKRIEAEIKKKAKKLKENVEEVRGRRPGTAPDPEYKKEKDSGDIVKKKKKKKTKKSKDDIMMAHLETTNKGKKSTRRKS